MAKTSAEIMQMLVDNNVKFVDLRFTDFKGKEQHVSVPVSAFDEDKFEEGHAFDGSSIAGWKGIEASDMLLMPDPDSARMDPFADEDIPTMILTCNVVEPSTGKGYDRDPRSVANRAEAYLKSTGIGDTAYFGPEPEFFIFNGVSWGTTMNHSFFKIESEEGYWSNGKDMNGANGLPLRAVISRFLRSTLSTISAPKCANFLKNKAFRLKFIIMKSAAAASAKSAHCSAL